MIWNLHHFEFTVLFHFNWLRSWNGNPLIKLQNFNNEEKLVFTSEAARLQTHLVFAVAAVVLNAVYFQNTLTLFFEVEALSANLQLRILILNQSVQFTQTSSNQILLIQVFAFGIRDVIDTELNLLLFLLIEWQYEGFYVLRI